ncbi:ribosomal RNA small subunit methyltransferase A [Salinadaptatus halalkaliphilus]|uniref:Probable ribosomal RNA small subunit methyltransferase A n=1 Tax=Salinadaptatus halalkaliphilus TaxID=2419781 RepID=A0A4V3VL41_9EURY|nr:16S rRNA (adenine(1518)-N(6)/adenine(1519)-N(6))-dimethyltransferase RsmA [Salinadaptatus halalkaliphilus]THE64187.1 ribosomal RNA small subunit methyltransferase A [Salinadaptatus halalkaliphilus]
MRDPDALIARAGVRGDPDRDQHFLVDDRVLNRLPTYLESEALRASDEGCEALRASDEGCEALRASDEKREAIDRTHLLEIGGGTGALTDRLLALEETDEVTVVERDPDLAAFLREEFRDEIDAGRLTVIEADALEVELPDFTASVSNLPYGVSSEIAFRLLPERRPLVLMFQQEFAERMVAEPGTSEYGRLSVSTQHYADVELVESIPKEAFSPPPAVQSAVVRAVPRPPEYEVDDEAFFLRFVKALFTQRRKTVRNAIRNTAHISGLEEPDAVVDAADEELLKKRPDSVTPAEFAELAALADRIGERTD